MIIALTIASCSKPAPTDCKVIIVGRIMSMHENTPLEHIRVTFSSAGQDRSSDIDTYTDKYGMYLIEATHFQKPVTCTISAEDPEGEHLTSAMTLEISLKGPAFDAEQNTFYINDCNFLLKRKE